MPRGKKGSKRSTDKSKNKNKGLGEQYFYEIGKGNKDKSNQGMGWEDDY